MLIAQPAPPWQPPDGICAECMAAAHGMIGRKRRRVALFCVHYGTLVTFDACNGHVTPLPTLDGASRWRGVALRELNDTLDVLETETGVVFDTVIAAGGFVRKSKRAARVLK